MKVKYLLPVFACWLFSCTAVAQKDPVTLILVRHAEKATEPADNPPLTTQGKQRAEQLSHLLSQQDVTAIYSTPFLRNMETVRPLSARTGLEITQYDPRGNPEEFLSNLAAEHAGGVVVVCGHSNTVPMMLNALTGSQSYEQLEESDYNDVFIVTLWPGNSPDVLHLTYADRGED